MATSGFNVGNLNDGGQVYVAWQLAYQSGIYSVINWQTGWRFLSSPLDRQLDAGFVYIGGADRWRNDGRVKNVGTNYTIRDWQAAAGTATLAHDANGLRAFDVAAGMTGYNGRRSAFSGAWHELPRISSVPPAPTPLTLDEITPTSMRFRFQSTGEGGSPVTAWRYRYSLSPLFETFTLGTSSGTSTVTDLIPGEEHYFQAQGINALGEGPWSTTISARTLPGGRKRVDGIWRTHATWRKSGGTWKRARPLKKIDGAWVPVA